MKLKVFERKKDDGTIEIEEQVLDLNDESIIGITIKKNGSWDWVNLYNHDPSKKEFKFFSEDPPGLNLSQCVKRIQTLVGVE